MKTTFNTLFLLLTILFLTSSLHLHDVSQNYISYLQSQQTNIKDKLNSLRQKLDNNYKTVQQQMDIDKKIQLLQQYIKQQRLLLSQIYLATANQQISNSQWVCTTLPQSTKKQINDALTGINSDLNDINKNIYPLNDTIKNPGVNKAIQQIQDALKTSVKLRQAIKSKGTEVSPSAIHPDKKTNLNAPNWILDGKPINQLNQQYKKAAESGALQVCNINEPFYSTKENKCVTCLGNRKYFSLRTSQCNECYNFDVKQHKCKDNEGAATNIQPKTQDKIIIPVGKTLDDYKKAIPVGTILCPQKAPYYTESECIACQTYFDIQAKKCVKCDGKNHYDSKAHTCVKQQVTITNLDVGKNSLIIPNDKTLNDISKDNKKLQQDKKVNVCPKQKPYYNDYQCISCAEGTLFSLIYKTCGTCQTGTFFNKNTNHCELKSYYSNLDDPNWSSTRTYPQIQKQIQQQSKDPLYQKCPVLRPFSTGKQCVQCAQDQHFDYDKKQCTKCYNGQQFNKNLHKCAYSEVNYQTNPQKAPKLIFEGRPKNQWMYLYHQNIQKNSGMSDCPQQNPYFDGMKCIICPAEHPYFNLEYKMCQKCAEGTKYEQNHHQCLTTQGNIASQVPTLEKMAAGIFS